VTWARVGEPQTWCVLNNYEIDMNKTIYRADSVYLTYTKYFNNPLLGRFEDMISVSTESFPRFESYTKVMEISNIGDGIRYRGGFQLQGINVIGKGDTTNKARLYFVDNKKTLIAKASADNFIIKEGERVVADKCETVVYFSKSDSIYHPSLDFRFDLKSRVMSIARGDAGLSKTPFFSSYHKMDMDIPKIEWNIDRDTMYIGQAKRKSDVEKATFESDQFFKKSQFERYQNIMEYNPLIFISNYSRQIGSRELDAELLAKKLNKNYTLQTINPLLIQLVEDGMIYYDTDRKIVTVKDKLLHFVKANAGNEDYDIIRVLSRPDSTAYNGRMTRSNLDMSLEGVKNVVINDSQLVVMKPYIGKIVLGKGKNMTMSGHIYAGYGSFLAQSAQFLYNDYKIKMDTINSFLLQIPTGEVDVDEVKFIKPLQSEIEDMKGEIIIDAPENKSSRGKIDYFPVMNTTTESHTYYDKKETVGGVYKRDSFYFKLEPFTFDSLDSYDPTGVNFKGTMVSAGIFQPFKENLRIQPDLSLGFVMKTPESGMSLYSNRGTFNDSLKLSNSGLLGKGSIKYLGAKFKSDDIIFMPKQLKATANDFRLEESRGTPQFPQAVGEDVSVNWLPYKDTMYVLTAQKPFEVFAKGDFTFKGLMALSPGGLYGKGTLDWTEARMFSRLMRFGAYSVSADTSDLVIKSMDTTRFAFNTRNVQAKLDFDAQRGTFKANSGALSTEMPYVNYRTSMNNFAWDMSGKKIEFLSDAQGFFQSTNEKQDSLIFKGTAATYNLTGNFLEVRGVDKINSADAFIYPDKGTVTIQENAYMDTLRNAKIVASTSNLYHNITEAKVHIRGKNDFTAEGYYEYNVGTKKQQIRFDNIVVKSEGAGENKKRFTNGNGPVRAEDNFLIGPRFGFKGNIVLISQDKNLQFDGKARLISQHLPDDAWFSLKSPIDRKDPAMSYNEPYDDNTEKVFAGFLLSRDSAHLYPRIMQPRYNRTDRPMFLAKGLIKYNEAKDEFTFGDSARIQGVYDWGNKLTLAERTGKIIAQGTFSMGEELEYINLRIAGQADGAINSGELDMSLVAAMNIPLPQKLVEIIQSDLYNVRNDLPDWKAAPQTIAQRGLLQGLNEILPKNTLAKTLSDVKEYQELNLPPQGITDNFIFSMLNMRWNQQTLSFTSKGNIGLGYLNAQKFNKLINAYIELRHPITGDEISILIDSPSGQWYYIAYKKGQLRAISSNGAFLAVLSSMKDKDKIIKLGKEKDAPTIQFDAGDANIANFFRNRMTGIQTPQAPQNNGEPTTPPTDDNGGNK
jgi:hypothetical protein